MNIDDIQIYLPKYLSESATQKLLDGLRDFPNNIDQRLYTNHLDESVIYQGDGLSNLIAVDLPKTTVKDVNGMIISNTCDISPENTRLFSSQILYAPIISLNNYKMVLTKKMIDEKVIESHIDEIRRQRITQIFYLPSMKGKIEESLVFFDRIFNIPISYINSEQINALRLFTLSDYGNYLFLFKLSLHFTRIRDKVERGSL